MMTRKSKRNLRWAAVAVLVLTVAAVLYAAGVKTDPIKWADKSIPLWGAIASTGGATSLLLLLMSAGELFAAVGGLVGTVLGRGPKK